jgi:hypothetical protein
MTLDSYDLYALAGERSYEVVKRFRDRWLTSLEPAAEEHEFPRYSDRPDAVYRSPWELIDRLLAAPEQPHSLYWSNRGPGEELHAMLFFTTDSGLIAGLTVANRQPRPSNHDASAARPKRRCSLRLRNGGAAASRHNLRVRSDSPHSRDPAASNVSAGSLGPPVATQRGRKDVGQEAAGYDRAGGRGGADR